MNKQISNARRLELHAAIDIVETANKTSDEVMRATYGVSREEAIANALKHLRAIVDKP